MAKDKDLKDFILRLQKMNANFDFIRKRSVAVGWVDGNKTHADYKSGKKHAKGKPASLAMIARILNYGSMPQMRTDGSVSQRIPPRPFMQTMVSEYGDYLNKVAVAEAKKIVNGTGNSADFFKNFGIRAKGALKRSMMRSELYAPNAESTIRRKKSSRPLIDTGTLINSADYEVRVNK